MNYKPLFKLARSKGYELYFMSSDGPVNKLGGYLGNEVVMELAGIQHWLTKEHKIHINVDYFNENVKKLRWTYRIDFLSRIQKVDKYLAVDHEHAVNKNCDELHYKSYNKALLKGIKYVLKNYL